MSTVKRPYNYNRFKEAESTLRSADNMARVITGHSIPDLAGRAAKFIFAPGGQMENVNDPYVILGVRKDAPNMVVKAAFRCMVKECHPDNGPNPDAVKFQRISEAYASIRKERGIK